MRRDRTFVPTVRGKGPLHMLHPDAQSCQQWQRFAIRQVGHYTQRGKKTKDARKGRGIASTVLYSDRVYSYYFNDVLGIVGSTTRMYD